MRKFKLLITSAALLLAGVVGYAQDISVRGTVTDESGAPVPAAGVVVSGTTRGVVTDASGRYQIAAPANGVLTFQALGYETRNVAVEGKSVINVVLAGDTELLDETIVVAYGTAKKSSFTGSASTVKSEGIAKRSVSNVTKAIDGLVAGVTTTSGSGQPGDGASIRIRGTGSINASSDPLYVVDGIPFAGTLASINPNDIESLTVLKDASASALYGSRAANGVVMITTKKGAEGRSIVNFKASMGLQSRSIKDYDVVNQDEFVELTWEALKNNYAFNGGYSAETAKALASANLSSALGGELYNPYRNYTWDNVIDPATGLVRDDADSAWNESWLDALTNKKAVRQEYQLGVSGGNSKTKYAFSFGYLDDKGVLITTGFKRYSLRANVDQKINNWFSSGASASYSYTNQSASQYSSTQTGNAWYTAQFMAPIYPLYLKDENKADVLDDFGKKQYDYGEGGRPTAARFNTVGDLYDNDYQTLRDNSGIRGYAILGGDDDSLGMLKGMTLSTNIGADISNRYLTSYYNPYHGDGAQTSGSIDKYATRTFSYTWNQILKYERNLDLSHILAQVGHEFYNYQYSYLYGSRTAVYPGIEELAPATNVTDNSSYSDIYRIESYFGRLAYDFSDKYYLEATWRTDGSSRFKKENRWGQFWSLGASWRISEESFMKNVPSVDNLTARISYGQLGNDSIGSYYAWQSFYDLTWPNASNPGAMVSTLETPDVSWEKKGTLNAGIEGIFLNKKLELTLEWYNSLTSDMLLSYPMPLSTGFGGYNANVGSMVNKGYEGTFKFNWFQGRNSRASSTLMLYANRNKVTALTGDNNTITSGSQVIKVGMPIYTWYMPKAAGVDPANGQMLYWAYEWEKDENGEIVKDASGDNVKKEGSDYVTSDKAVANQYRYYMGSREPKLQGSFGSDFQFGPIDFSFLTTFSLGGKVYDSVYASIMEVTYSGHTWSKNALRRWQEPGDVTDVPMLLLNSGNASADRWLIDASYFAIKSVQLGYTLPESLTQKAGIKSLRLFATGDNIALFSKLNGLNPQYNYTGGTSWAYTPTRAFTVGVDINF